jgi:hypothetical protein
MEQKMMEIQLEQRGTELDLLKLVTEEHLMVRFLDDISNRYEQLKLTLPLHSVDELSFIELEKVTPLISRISRLCQSSGTSTPQPSSPRRSTSGKRRRTIRVRGTRATKMKTGTTIRWTLNPTPST